MLQTLDFKGKTALIMGASRGIGLATAQILSQYGATVVLTARSSDAIVEGAEQINNNGGDAYAIPCDVSDYQSVEACVEQCLAKVGKIDFLINIAGVIEPLAHLIDSDPAQWGIAADINYKGVYYCMRAVLPSMVKEGGGIVVNMSSGAANSALSGWSHYCSSKAAAKKLTEVAHKDCMRKIYAWLVCRRVRLPRA